VLTVGAPVSGGNSGDARITRSGKAFECTQGAGRSFLQIAVGM
jgi:hypothetical protein